LRSFEKEADMRFIEIIKFPMVIAFALSLAACSPAAAPTAAVAPTAAPTPTVAPTVEPTATVAPTATQAATFSDPFAYCAAVGTIDEPDARYVGPKMPDVIVKGVLKATGASPDAPVEVFAKGTYWRCMDGKVYACTVGANLPCTAKADTSRTPTSAETEFCTANPNADVVPAAVTGRETVYEWRCKDGAPEIVRQVFTPDARGFISDFWYALSPN
jgi:hypothetical protein